MVVDALRADHVGFLGYHRDTTPFLDQLSAESLVFDNALSHGSQTVQSTASLLASDFFPPILLFHSDDAKAAVADERLANKGSQLAVLCPERTTFPQRFSEAGYWTAAFLTNPHHHAASGFPDMFDEAHHLESQSSRLPYAGAREVLARFKSWVQNWEVNERPYLAYVHLMDVHNPYRAPEEFRSKFVTSRGRDVYQNAVPSGDSLPSASDLRFMLDNYDAEIAYVDSVLGELHAAALRSTAGNLIFVLTSDHGDEFMEHGGLGHGRTLEKELLHVPLLISGDDLPQGRFSGLVRQVDIGPTLLELVGLDPLQGVSGRSLLPRLSSPGLASERVISIAQYGGLLSLTTSRWHLIRNRRSGETKLYDNRRDPRGLIDIAESRPDLVEELEQGLLGKALAARQAAIQRKRAMAETCRDRALNPEDRESVMERLKSLGYIN